LKVVARMSDAQVGAARPEPDARLPNTDELGPAIPLDKREPKLLRLLKLVAAAAAMAVSSAVLGLLTMMLVGLVFGRTAGGGFEVRSWAAIAIGQLLLGAFALWRSQKRFGPGWRTAIGLRAVALDHRLAGRVVLAVALYWSWAALVISVAGLSGRLKGPPDIVPNSAAALAAFTMTAVVLAPLCEEAFFRGYVQTRAQAFLSPAVSVALPALLFALAHFSGNVAQPAVVFMLGVLAGHLRRASGSLVPGIILHALNNGCLVLLVTLAR
jgi:membrane protease YdiL (CAAX protease family)